METLSSLDQEISLLQGRDVDPATIRQVRSRRNALIALCSLPTEILVHILEVLNAFDYEERARMRNRWPVLFDSEAPGTLGGWMDVAGVCTHIRNCVVNAPQLWANIDLSRQMAWVRLCIARSGNVPCALFSSCTLEKVDTDEQAAFVQSVIAQTLPLAHHVDIRVPAHQAGMLSQVDAMLCLQPLPRLRTLTYMPTLNRHPDPAYRPDRFLRDVSALTHLKLGSVEISLDCLYLPSLVHLMFVNVCISESPEYLGRFLAQAAGLRHVHLEIRYKVRAPHPHIEPVRLSHLRSLYLAMALPLSLVHLQALPVPLESLDVRASPAADADNNASGDMAALQGALFDHMMRMLDVRHSDPVARPILARRGHFTIGITHTGSRTVRVRYTTSGPLAELRAVMNRVQVIKVGAITSYPLELFRLATSDPSHEMTAVERVVIFKACSKRLYRELRAWLQARATIGHRIRTVTFQRCSPGACYWGDPTKEKQVIEEMIADMTKAGLADVIQPDWEQDEERRGS